MEWNELKIFTSNMGIDPLCGVLANIGADGFVIDDPADFDEFIADKTSNFDYVAEDLFQPDREPSVTVYLPGNAQGAEMFSLIKAELTRLKNDDKNKNFGRLEYESGSINEEDWANNWKQYFKPIEAGARLVIKPSWEDYDNKDNRIIVEIDPASSFGTGQHATTRLCLELLQDVVGEGCTMLDLGCGSGILSAAGALLLKQGHVTAVDIQENAVTTTEKNMSANKIAPERYTVICGNVLEDGALADKICEETGGFDVITANIVADVIIAMKDLFARFLKPCGTLIVSGIISERGDEVENVLNKAGFKTVRTRENDDWKAFQLTMD